MILQGLKENLMKDWLLRAQGLSNKEIAETLYKTRRELGVKYKNLTPDDLREYIYEAIIKSSQRPNGNVDKLLKNFKEWLIKKNQ